MHQSRSRPSKLGLWLVAAGIIGWFAAFILVVERFASLQNPGRRLACDISPLVQCSANLEAWQGAVFGFPNPLIGVAGWMAPIVVGVALIGGVRFPKWFYTLFTAGITFAFFFVAWLIWQSIYVLGTLCPWCMVTWAVTIPTFYAVVLHGWRTAQLPGPRRLRRAANGLMGWLPVMVVSSYALIAVLAQLRLDVLGRLF